MYGAVYQAYKPLLGGWEMDVGKDGKQILLYGGDADLTKDQNGRADFTFGNILEANKSLSIESKLYLRGRCGVNQ